MGPGLKRILSLVPALASAAGMAAERFDIDGLFRLAGEAGRPESIWEFTAGDFPAEWRETGDFFWSDFRGKGFHYSCELSEADLCFADMPLAAAEFNLSGPGGTLESITMLVAADGMDFNVNADPLRVADNISRRLDTGPAEPEVLFRSERCTLSGISWTGEWGTLYLWTVTAEPERRLLYMGMLLSPWDDAPEEVLASDGAVTVRGGTDRVKLNIPPLSQGDMNYCVPAAAARIARYYHSGVDCAMIAALTGCRDDRGIELGAVDRVLNGISPVTGLECRMLYRNGDYFSYAAIADFLEAYNRKARKLGKKRFPLRRLHGMDDEEAVRFLTVGLSGLDRSVLHAMRQADGENRERFLKLVRRKLREGTPLLWCVLSGEQDEEIAFHLRLLHGFKNNGEEYLWSDSVDVTGREHSVDGETLWDVTAFLAELSPASSGDRLPEADHSAF